MATCGSLSREYCDTCERDSLHASSRCVHCGSVRQYMPVRVQETDIERYFRESRKLKEGRNVSERG